MTMQGLYFLRRIKIKNLEYDGWLREETSGENHRSRFTLEQI